MNEHSKYQGFFVIPTISHVVISKNGEVLNTYTGNQLTPIIRNHGYYSVNFSVVKEGSKVERQYLIHRLLALAFIPIPENLSAYGIKLQVNHKDGNKLNNSLTNFEWCLPKYNMQHAFGNKLIDIGKNVLAKDIRSGIITSYPSTAACAKVFRVTPVSLRRHLAGPLKGRRTINWCIFKYDDEMTWPFLEASEENENTWGMDSVIVASRDDNEKVFIFASLKEFCRIMSYDYIMLKNSRQRHGLSYPFKGWHLEEFSSLADVNGSVLRDIIHERHVKDKRRFRVTDLLTQQVSIVTGIQAVAALTNYSAQHLSQAIKEGKNKMATHEIEIIAIDQGQQGITLPRA